MPLEFLYADPRASNRRGDDGIRGSHPDLSGRDRWCKCRRILLAAQRNWRVVAFEPLTLALAWPIRLDLSLTSGSPFSTRLVPRPQSIDGPLRTTETVWLGNSTMVEHQAPRPGTGHGPKQEGGETCVFITRRQRKTRSSLGG